jgi:hypothetical protein
MYEGDVRLRGLDREAWHSWPNPPDGRLPTLELLPQAPLPADYCRSPPYPK